MRVYTLTANHTKLCVSGRPNSGLTRFVLGLWKQDLRLLTSLTGRASRISRLTIMKLLSDLLKPLCKDDSETSLPIALVQPQWLLGET